MRFVDVLADKQQLSFEEFQMGITINFVIYFCDRLVFFISDANHSRVQDALDSEKNDFKFCENI